MKKSISTHYINMKRPVTKNFGTITEMCDLTRDFIIDKTTKRVNMHYR